MSSSGKAEKIAFTGVVTKSQDGIGMVGDDVFFVKSVVKGPFPQVNDRVLVQAERVHGMPFKYSALRVQGLFKNFISNTDKTGLPTPKPEISESKVQENVTADRNVYSPTSAFLSQDNSSDSKVNERVANKKNNTHYGNSGKCGHSQQYDPKPTNTFAYELPISNGLRKEVYGIPTVSVGQVPGISRELSSPASFASATKETASVVYYNDAMDLDDELEEMQNPKVEEPKSSYVITQGQNKSAQNIPTLPLVPYGFNAHHTSNNNISNQYRTEEGKPQNHLPEQEYYKNIPERTIRSEQWQYCTSYPSRTVFKAPEKSQDTITLYNDRQQISTPEQSISNPNALCYLCKRKGHYAKYCVYGKAEPPKLEYKASLTFNQPDSSRNRLYGRPIEGEYNSKGPEKSQNTETLFKDSQRISTPEQSISNPNALCYLCKKRGHYAKYCVSGKTEPSKSEYKGSLATNQAELARNRVDKRPTDEDVNSKVLEEIQKLLLLKEEKDKIFGQKELPTLAAKQGKAAGSSLAERPTDGDINSNVLERIRKILAAKDKILEQKEPVKLDCKASLAVNPAEDARNHPDGRVNEGEVNSKVPESIRKIVEPKETKDKIFGQKESPKLDSECKSSLAINPAEIVKSGVDGRSSDGKCSSKVPDKIQKIVEGKETKDKNCGQKEPPKLDCTGSSAANQVKTTENRSDGLPIQGEVNSNVLERIRKILEAKKAKDKESLEQKATPKLDCKNSLAVNQAKTTGIPSDGQPNEGAVNSKLPEKIQKLVEDKDAKDKNIVDKEPPKLDCKNTLAVNQGKTTAIRSDGQPTNEECNAKVPEKIEKIVEAKEAKDKIFGQKEPPKIEYKSSLPTNQAESGRPPEVNSKVPEKIEIILEAKEVKDKGSEQKEFPKLEWRSGNDNKPVVAKSRVNRPPNAKIRTRVPKQVRKILAKKAEEVKYEKVRQQELHKTYIQPPKLELPLLSTNQVEIAKSHVEERPTDGEVNSKVPERIRKILEAKEAKDKNFGKPSPKRYGGPPPKRSKTSFLSEDSLNSKTDNDSSAAAPFTDHKWGPPAGDSPVFGNPQWRAMQNDSRGQRGPNPCGTNDWITPMEDAGPSPWTEPNEFNAPEVEEGCPTFSNDVWMPQGSQGVHWPARGRGRRRAMHNGPRVPEMEGGPSTSFYDHEGMSEGSYGPHGPEMEEGPFAFSNSEWMPEHSYEGGGGPQWESGRRSPVLLVARNKEDIPSVIRSRKLERLQKRLQEQTEQFNYEAPPNPFDAFDAPNPQFDSYNEQYYESAVQDKPADLYRTEDGAPVCFYCKKVGHKAKNCRHAAKDSTEQSSSDRTEDGPPFCFYCQKKGHTTTNCWHAPKESTEQSSSDRTEDGPPFCFYCQKKGHTTKNCWHAAQFESTEQQSYDLTEDYGPPFCSYCQKTGHLAANCWHAPKFESPEQLPLSSELYQTEDGLPVCFHCQKVGHIARNCWHAPKFESTEQSSSDRTEDGAPFCTFCQKKGHFAKKCRHAAKFRRQ